MGLGGLRTRGGGIDPLEQPRISRRIEIGTIGWRGVHVRSRIGVFNRICSICGDGDSQW